MRILALALLLVMISACSSVPPPPPPPITIEKPVPVACVKNRPVAPAFPDTDVALREAPNVFERVKLLVAGRLMRIAYQAKLEAALAACE